MTALVTKEVRLLLPSYGAAMLLAIVPVWVLPVEAGDERAAIALLPFSFGLLLLALSSFGREFGLGTFALNLAQPLERTLLWRTKFTVLAAAMATAWGLWSLSCVACVYAGGGPLVWRETLAFGSAAVAAAFTGGLWTTLLLRQVVAAFWFSLLIPVVIMMVIGLTGWADWVAYAALGIYSLTGFLFARWVFLRIQESGWTGGVVSIPGWMSARVRSRQPARIHRPLAALLRKEFQLHQVGLLGMAGLFVVHLGVVWLRQQEVNDVIRKGLEVFGGIWLVVPLLVGGQSVAEERKLGTWTGQLCLPVSKRTQFILKLVLVLLIGGVLSPVLLIAAEATGDSHGIGSGIHTDYPILMFSTLALIGFYASTLSRSVVQSLAIALVVALVLGTVEQAAGNGMRISNVLFWRGQLLHYLGLPLLLVAFLWLAARNFRQVSESWRLWSRSAIEFGAVVVGIATLTTAVYHRAWELIVPSDPPVGPARLSKEKPPRITSNGAGGLAVLLPDGRLWVDRVAYVPGRLFLAFGEETGIRGRGRWISLSPNRFLPGSNWVSAVTAVRETVGIRSDGSLWVSENPRDPWNREGKAPEPRIIELVQFGKGTDWKSVVLNDYWWSSLFLLKQDGTLWHWGTNSFPSKQEWPGLRSFEPTRVGDSTNWVKIVSAGRNCYLWMNDGTAWISDPLVRNLTDHSTAKYAGVYRFPSLDDTKWLSLGGAWTWEGGVRDDGTLWVWSSEFKAASGGEPKFSPRLVQVGTDWSAMAGDFPDLVTALKKDGSLWQWRVGLTPPTRLGSQTNWVAISSALGGTISLAADGSLWFWYGRGGDNDRNSDQPLLSVSRSPSKIGNIFGAQD